MMSTRAARKIGVATALAATLASAAPVCARPAGGEPPVFEMRDGRAVLRGWDDRAATAPRELLSITADQFAKPAHVYSERVIFEDGAVITNPFRVPDAASTLTVIARGVPESTVFPRLRVTIASDGATTRTVFEGYLQSLGIARLPGVIPPEFRGKTARVSVEFLNPSALNDHRQVWLARVVVE
jgi:hypothetical protein